MADPILTVTGLTKHFSIKKPGVFRRQRGSVQAVNDVSFELYQGETLGIVGETGSGKSTVARLLMALETPTAGSVTFGERDLAELRPEELRALRREVQMIFQDPYASLSPRMTVERLVQEPWLVQGGPVPRKDWAKRTKELLEQVGLPPDAASRYPHQFSGGQRQRIGIARALALEPKVLICDEPVSALDVSIQAQIINLLTRLQRELEISFIFIAHDLSVVRHISDRVAVMYLGRIVESGDVEQVYRHPLHPYTQALLSAVPSVDPDQAVDAANRIPLQGELPSPTDPPTGCNFSTRCWLAEERCFRERPELELRGFEHPSSCHFAGERPLNAPVRTDQGDAANVRKDAAG